MVIFAHTEPCIMQAAKFIFKIPVKELVYQSYDKN